MPAMTEEEFNSYTPEGHNEGKQLSPHFWGMKWPNYDQLFSSRSEAHQAMMEVLHETVEEMKLSGEPLPPFPEFFADFKECFQVFLAYSKRV